jgi:nitrite reductase (NO-forming)
MLAAIVAGCTPKADPYDESKMDLKPTPAMVSNARHKGPYFEGEALSSVPVVRSVGTDPVKTIQIDVIDRVIEIAPGVNFKAWTFGGQVPGPIVHARVGDRIRFSMTNRSDETMPGVTSPACR